MNWKGFYLSCRPKTLFASAGPIFLGTALSIPTENSILFPLILISGILMQILSNLVNDYFDSIDGIDSDLRVGPLRAIHMGLITNRELKWFSILIFGICIGLGILISILSSFYIFYVGLFCLLFAFLYTGGPFPLSRIGLGEIAAFFFFGPVPVLGTMFILNGYFSFDALVFSFIPGLLSGFLMAINNLRDRDEDKKVGKITIASLLSKSSAEKFTLSFLFLSILHLILLSIYYTKYSFWLLIALVALIPFLKGFLGIAKGVRASELNEILGNAGKYLALNCFLISMIVYLGNKGLL